MISSQQSGGLLLATAGRSETLIFAKGENATESCCGARKNHRAYAFPRFFRPLHCARVAPPATGGAPLAYPTSYARRTLTPDGSCEAYNQEKGGSQHPYRMPSVALGLFPGLKKCPPDTFLPCRSARPPSSSPAEKPKKKDHPLGGLSFLVAEAGLEPTTSGL